RIPPIGFHLYTRLLSAAVRRRRPSVEGPVPDLEAPPGAEEPIGAEIDLPLAAMLPPGYISDRALRLRLYRRLAMLRRESELPELRRELEDRFGPPPKEVDNLLFLLRTKMRAAEGQGEGMSVEN